MDNGVMNIMILVLVLLCFWIFLLWMNSRKLRSGINLVAQQHNLLRTDDRACDLCRAIHLINPDVTAGVDYVIRHDNPQHEPVIDEWKADAPMPTTEQIRSALTELADVHHEEDYADMRQAEYPTVGEQLEAAYEARQGNTAKQLELDEKIRRVREKYPKVDECL
jgi:hypothetical protein